MTISRRSKKYVSADVQENLTSLAERILKKEMQQSHRYQDAYVFYVGDFLCSTYLSRGAKKKLCLVCTFDFQIHLNRGEAGMEPEKAL